MDTTAPGERLAQLLFLLGRRGRAGVPAEELLRVVRYGGGDDDARRRQLARDIDQLRRVGWTVRNEAPPGADARYRLLAGDIRLRVQFPPDEQAELQRVARLAHLPDVAAAIASDEPDAGAAQSPDGIATVTDPRPVAEADTDALDEVLHALRSRCVLSVTYRGRRRELHPQSLHSRPTGWYLMAAEAPGGGPLKSFRVDRMADVAVGAPGSAPAPGPVEARPSLDPVSWRRDDPVVALVQTDEDHLPQVEDLLGTATGRRRPEPGGAGDAADGTVLVEIPVTNRAAFRARLYELGTRVRLLGPDVLREEVAAELRAVVAGLA